MGKVQNDSIQDPKCTVIDPSSLRRSTVGLFTFALSGKACLGSLSLDIEHAKPSKLRCFNWKKLRLKVEKFFLISEFTLCQIT